MKRSLIQDHTANSCFFRSSVEIPYRKALVQITERCNLHCAHCFVPTEGRNDMMSLETIRAIVLPRLKQCRVATVTLTGGEPFLHHDIVEIVKLFRNSDMPVSICTNATVMSSDQLKSLANMGDVQINVSLDGFSPDSHGRFRGNKSSFFATIENAKKLGEHGLLKGFLTTPNNLASIDEYAEICTFAIANGAKYVLMNPLTRFGRGVESKTRLGSPDHMMNEIRDLTSRLGHLIEIVYIRFPNARLPLASCEAGNIIYVFTDGAVAVCPYMVFAARNHDSKHQPEEFIVGNILHNANIAESLDNYEFHDRYHLGSNETCRHCSLESGCGKGCPAATMASGQYIEGVDVELCPAITAI